VQPACQVLGPLPWQLRSGSSVCRAQPGVSFSWCTNTRRSSAIAQPVKPEGAHYHTVCPSTATVSGVGRAVDCNPSSTKQGMFEDTHVTSYWYE
jgi:hypothetical protein